MADTVAENFKQLNSCCVNSDSVDVIELTEYRIQILSNINKKWWDNIFNKLILSGKIKLVKTVY